MNGTMSIQLTLIGKIFPTVFAGDAFGAVTFYVSFVCCLVIEGTRTVPQYSIL